MYSTLFRGRDRRRGFERVTVSRAGTHFSLANTTSWCHGSFFVSRFASSVDSAFASFSVLVLAALMRSALTTFDMASVFRDGKPGL
jgi:hypothetical protein